MSIAREGIVRYWYALVALASGILVLLSSASLIVTGIRLSSLQANNCQDGTTGYVGEAYNIDCKNLVAYMWIWIACDILRILILSGQVIWGLRLFFVSLNSAKKAEGGK